MLVLRIELDVGDMDDRALEDRPAGTPGPVGARRIYATHTSRPSGVKLCWATAMDQLAVELKERAEESVA